MPTSLSHLADSYYSTAQSLHRHFDETFWHQPSYHNAEHIRAVWTAAEQLIAALPDKDPTDILPSLMSWNTTHRTHITVEDFRDIARIAFSCHDLGNIARTDDCWRNGIASTGFCFFEQYQSHAAEDRSISMFYRLIEGLGAELSFPVELVVHLTKETSFRLTESPFGLFTRVADQMSSTFFRDSFEVEIGLLYEWVAEEPDKMINPYRHFNFGHFRIQQLLDAKQIKELCDIWAVTVPELDDRFLDEEVKIADFLLEYDEKALVILDVVGTHSDTS